MVAMSSPAKPYIYQVSTRAKARPAGIVEGCGDVDGTNVGWREGWPDEVAVGQDDGVDNGVRDGCDDG